MKNRERRILRRLALAAAAILIATTGAWAQSTEPPAEMPQAPQAPIAQEPAPPAQPTVPQVTGTVVKFAGTELDLKTKDGKEQKVALNEGTKTLVEIAKGIEVTVEYRRKIGGFVIAERVLAAGAAPATEPVPAPVLKTSTATGDILSATDASLVLRTEQGDLTFFLAPSTEILVKPLAPGLKVTVEYREDKDQTKVAIRVLPAKSDEPETPPPATPPATPPPAPPPGD
ncbi:MAG TPA: hypothetical protein VN851_03280 [Thermoanaerobaculia bacterium]|nr:hypothetical protein [Thermoanaerobaculia bacterium]